MFQTQLRAKQYAVIDESGKHQLDYFRPVLLRALLFAVLCVVFVLRFLLCFLLCFVLCFVL
jgi:hypothetical protein